MREEISGGDVVIVVVVVAGRDIVKEAGVVFRERKASSTAQIWTTNHHLQQATMHTRDSQDNPSYLRRYSQAFHRTSIGARSLDLPPAPLSFPMGYYLPIHLAVHTGTINITRHKGTTLSPHTIYVSISTHTSPSGRCGTS